MPVTVRLERLDDPVDRVAIRAVTAAAFGDQGAAVADLVDALRASDADRGLSLVAERDGAVVGHTLLTRSWVDAPRALVEVLVLSPLSVRPEVQRQGIGRTLVAQALAAARAARAPAVFLEGDPAYYGRLGFVAAGPLGFGRPSERIPEAAFQVVLLDVDEPWMRGRLVYADRFWALDCVGLRDPLA